MRFLNQSEQTGGFWLTNIKLDDSKPLPFGFQLSVNHQTLALFRQTGNEAQFLSTAAVELDEINSIQSNLETPTWQIFNEMLHDNATTQQSLLLLASDVNIANLLHFAHHSLAPPTPTQECIALLEASNGFPFTVKPAKFMFEAFPPEAIGACPLLEDWKIPNRLCSQTGLPGCYDGNIESALAEWQTTDAWQSNWRIVDFRTLNEAITNS